ncbi:MAG: hypothetical protein Q9168_002390 [Polycauliona sp. 1 TL-2023]
MEAKRKLSPVIDEPGPSAPFSDLLAATLRRQGNQDDYQEVQEAEQPAPKRRRGRVPKATVNEPTTANEPTAANEPATVAKPVKAPRVPRAKKQAAAQPANRQAVIPSVEGKEMETLWPEHQRGIPGSIGGKKIPGLTNPRSSRVKQVQTIPAVATLGPATSAPAFTFGSNANAASPFAVRTLLQPITTFSHLPSTTASSSQPLPTFGGYGTAPPTLPAGSSTSKQPITTFGAMPSTAQSSFQPLATGAFGEMRTALPTWSSGSLTLSSTTMPRLPTPSKPVSGIPAQQGLGTSNDGQSSALQEEVKRLMAENQELKAENAGLRVKWDIICGLVNHSADGMRTNKKRENIEKDMEVVVLDD